MPICELAPTSFAQPYGSDAEDPCARVGIVAAGRAFVSTPDVGLSRGLSLPLARVTLGAVSAGDVQGRVALLAVRSGGETGYIGVEGEAIVPVFEIAEARWDARSTGLMLAAGIVDDLWVGPAEAAWGRRDVAATLAGDRGWVDRSDIGGVAGWTSPDGLASVSVAVTSGEGALRRERNTGVNVTAAGRLRLGGDGPVGVELGAMGREGSRGVGQAADHRAGASVLIRHEWVVGGAEGLLGWGLDGDATLLPAGLSLWARAGDDLPLVAWGRLDRATDTRTVEGAGDTAIFIGGGPRLPLRGPAYAALAWEGRSVGVASAAIPGANALRASDTFYLQIGVGAVAGVPLGEPE